MEFKRKPRKLRSAFAKGNTQTQAIQHTHMLLTTSIPFPSPFPTQARAQAEAGPSSVLPESLPPSLPPHHPPRPSPPPLLYSSSTPDPHHGHPLRPRGPRQDGFGRVHGKEEIRGGRVMHFTVSVLLIPSLLFPLLPFCKTQSTSGNFPTVTRFLLARIGDRGVPQGGGEEGYVGKGCVWLYMPVGVGHDCLPASSILCLSVFRNSYSA